MNYEIELARKIIDTQDVIETNYIPIRSDDTTFAKYKDKSIEIIAAKNTQALHITIYNPLTSAKSNPIIYVDDNGKCYRNHGERIYFVKYAKELLNIK